MSAICPYGNACALHDCYLCTRTPPSAVPAQPAEPREWSLPLNTLIINSNPNRPNGVRVVEREAYDALKAKYDGVFAQRMRFAAEVDALRDKLSERKNWPLLVAENARLRAALEQIASRPAWHNEYDLAKIAREALKADSIYMPIADVPTAAYEAQRDVSGDDELGIEYTAFKKEISE